MSPCSVDVEAFVINGIEENGPSAQKTSPFEKTLPQTNRNVPNSQASRNANADAELSPEYVRAHTSGWHPSLGNLATALRTRFEQAGDRSDLGASIKYYEEAVLLCPPGQSERSEILSNLAQALRIRFEQAGDRRDLNDSIERHREALLLTPYGHSRRPIALDNLGIALRIRFEQTGNGEDLAASIMSHEEALNYLSPEHPERPIALDGLATSYRIRSEQTGNLSDLNTSIEYHGSALELRPAGHPGRSLALGNLATALRIRFEHAGDRYDLDTSIAYHQEALALHGVGHPRRSLALGNLARTLGIQLEQDGGLSDQIASTESGRQDAKEMIRNKIIALLQEACESETSGLPIRLRLSLDWVTFAMKTRNQTALQAYITSLELFDQSITTAQSLTSQHARLSNGTLLLGAKRLPLDAAACALNENRVELAVELLERGRGILFAQLRRLRVPLEDLTTVSEELAGRFVTISSRLEGYALREQSLALNDDGRHIMLDEVGRYQATVTEWKDIVRQIRALPGFDSFLKPTPFKFLAQAACEGPVIIVNISELRSDAIIVTDSDHPVVVPLPEATPANVDAISSRLAVALRGDTGRCRKYHMVHVLRELWDGVVGVIVERLRCMGLPFGSRIWWCPTYKACQLPLHAAGLYRKGQEHPNLPDTFISSYTPTLTTLITARAAVLPPRGSPSVFAVGVSIPGGLTTYTQLGAVEAELRRIEEHAPKVKVMQNEVAKHNAVLSELSSHTWLHMACHGQQNTENPFQSSFRLHDGPLTLEDIASLRLPNAELAFLSACHAATGDQNAPDEALHLVGTLQLVGFRSVVGTLWMMDDTDGPDAAEEFYRYMFRRSEESVDFRDSAAAVSSMTRVLRRNKVPPERWVNFVHIGV